MNPAPAGKLSRGVALKAYAEGRDTIIVFDNGVEQVRAGGSRAWRNNNPGNMRNYAFSKGRGSIGEAGGFAVFKSESDGMSALKALLRTRTYQSLNILDAISRYAPPNENNTAGYQKFIESATGIQGTTMMNALSGLQLDKVTLAIRRIEGWQIGLVSLRMALSKP